jgi:hypothetical protein
VCKAPFVFVSQSIGLKDWQLKVSWYVESRPLGSMVMQPSDWKIHYMIDVYAPGLRVAKVINLITFVVHCVSRERAGFIHVGRRCGSDM